MELSTLVSPLSEKRIIGESESDIRGLAYDSREVKPGFLFAAIRGTHQDGHAYIPGALERGAAALLVEAPAPGVTVPQVVVPRTRPALADLADQFYHHPAQSLKLIGVTGTNGKTTTTYLCESIFREAGMRTGIIGTIQYKVADKVFEGKNTTPESLDLFKLFAEMADSRVKACVMEVSSHALDQGRIHGIAFDVMVFTNLTQDHLDYHKTMDAYFKAKAKLFTELPSGKNPTTVINEDDPYGQKLLQKLKIPAITYGIEQGCVKAGNVKADWKGVSFLAKTPKGKLPIQLRLCGRFNVYNALAALGTGIALGVPLETIRRGLQKVERVRGRFEQIQKGQKFAVIVDYAHSPDGLLNLLEAARSLTPGRLLVVFGCGGDRDRGKRPIMGEIAERFGDAVVLTSDNPRSEEPLAIIQEIEKGMRKKHEVEPDRKKAIVRALSTAKEGDCVVIAGKGHESYQIFKDKTLHFDDREVVEAFLGEMTGGEKQARKDSA